MLHVAMQEEQVWHRGHERGRDHHRGRARRRASGLRACAASGPTGPTGAPGIGSGFQVVDRLGNSVGTFTGGSLVGDPYYNVLRRENGFLLSLRVHSDGVESDDLTSFFESGDCSGQPYVYPGDLGVRPVQASGGDPPTLAYYGGDPMRDFASNSYEFSFSPGESCPYVVTRPGFCCRTDSFYTGGFAPAVAFDLSRFSPPFSVK